jgi:hypothetical protein
VEEQHDAIEEVPEADANWAVDDDAVYERAPPN